MARDNSNNGILHRHLQCGTYLEREGAPFADPYLQEAHQDRGLLLARVAHLEALADGASQDRELGRLDALEQDLDRALLKARQRTKGLMLVEQLARPATPVKGLWARLCEAMFPKKGAPNAEEDR